jgi:exonuclease SbcC
VKDGLVKLRADFAERRQAVSTKLQPLGIADIPETDISSLIETLRARLKAWQAQVKRKGGHRETDCRHRQRGEAAGCGYRNSKHRPGRKAGAPGTLKKELATGSDERNALYGDKNPDDEERHLNKAISDAEGPKSRPENGTMSSNKNGIPRRPMSNL